MLSTIAAIATPPGKGGVGIVRISGPNAKNIAKKLLGECPLPRKAIHTHFLDKDKSIIDEGIALFFLGPNSFTGEDVLELQGHGGPVILDYLLQRILKLDVRIARPGEFSERAFLNNKMDLAQAEAVADLIDSASLKAARSAMRSLQGDFSKRINLLVDALIHLRIFIESAIDFPEEEIDFLKDETIDKQFNQIFSDLEAILQAAQKGVLLREGLSFVIAGKPNAGKSSLLNQLCGVDAAIVTEIPGTTRDVVREHIQIDGVPITIIDTAGLRKSDDRVEQEGIKRTREQMQKADRILLVVDGHDEQTTKLANLWPENLDEKIKTLPVTIVRNKVDLCQEKASVQTRENDTIVSLSAKTGEGIDLLLEHLKTVIGINDGGEGEFIARRRHLDAIERAKSAMYEGFKQLKEQRAGELFAEELRMAQQHLSEITGTFTPDDLLGKIFSSFCIGK